ncbi:MAG TPA: acyltransferase [Acidimicrobiia bacterium]|nr:acyltransferase [Acidimicrobiia bacterium]
MATATTTPSDREVYLDFVRAISLIVVVIFHWAFTILEFRPDQVKATNPIGSTPGMWVLTWVLQVVPLFFFVGGYVHFRSWEKAQRRGVGWWRFVSSRWRRLVVPALGVVGAWIAVGVVIGLVRDVPWISSAVLLIVSPLWFLAVYAVLVFLAPATVWLHRRWGSRVVVVLVAVAMGLDMLRFIRGYGWAGWLNLLIIWSFCHQLGMHYGSFVGLKRRTRWLLVLGGMFALLVLTTLAPYPRSMVGVPEDGISNAAPPTLAMGALLLLQVGVALILRDRVTRRLTDSPRWAALNDLVGRFSMPLYLLHTTGFVVALGIVYLGLSHLPPSAATGAWWMERPVWLALTAAVTVPIVLLGSRWLGNRPAVSQPGDLDEGDGAEAG